MAYQVQKHSVSSWNMDGSAIIERDCGHEHRTLEAAERCLDNLIDYNNRTGMWNAGWHLAKIVEV